MRGKGINYDTGARFPARWTRETFDSATARRELEVIARDLHCTAVRISGSDPARLTIAAEHAAALGLEVWFSPFPCDLTASEMFPLFAECAERAEALRASGAKVVLVTGGELSIFDRGFLPGDDVVQRAASLRNGVPEQLNAFLGEVVDDVRRRFGGLVTYASLPIEQIDWTHFDYVSVDAYRAAHNVSTFRDEVRTLHRFGLPVAVTEFGCCTFRGAADEGGRGWLIVDRTTWTLDADYVRDEAGQSRYFAELATIFEEEGIDTAFWYTYAGYNFPHHPQEPRRDLDLASYGVIRLDPNGTWHPKSVFHTLSSVYAESS